MGVVLPGRGAGRTGQASSTAVAPSARPASMLGPTAPAPHSWPCWRLPRSFPGASQPGGNPAPGTCALLPGSRVISKDHPHPRCLDTQHSLLGTLLPPC